jgi:hypothetical protein
MKMSLRITRQAVLVFFSCILGIPVVAQIGINTLTPNTSSMLDIVSDSRGVLLPRMTKTKRDQITQATDGLVVYCTDCTPASGFYVYQNSKWERVGQIISSDGLFTGASDAVVPSQKAVAAYVSNNKGLLLTNSSNKNVHGNTNNLVSHHLSAKFNTATGYSALMNVYTGDWNTAIGYESGLNLTSGASNLFAGESSAIATTTGGENVAVGALSLKENVNGSGNVALGYRAGYKNKGHSNVYVGRNAGYNSTGYSNIYIGDRAGFYDNSIAGTERLFIENSSSTSPLIGGDFKTDQVGINIHIDSLNVSSRATLQIGGDVSLTDKLTLTNGSIPLGSAKDGIHLYTQDVNSSSELKVIDEAGNITTLSPHNFSLSPKSDPMAWSFYSENAEIGERINVDMLRVVKLIEKISGERLVYRENLETGERLGNELNEGAISELRTQLAELKKLVEKQDEKIHQLEKDLTKKSNSANR